MAIDMTQFYQVFFEESEEHLAAMETLLLNLDIDYPDAEMLNAIFRVAHSIKGSAGTFGFTDLAETTHILESLLDRIRKRELALRADMVDVFLECGDLLRSMLGGHQGRGAVSAEATEKVCLRLRQLSSDQSVSVAPVSLATTDEASRLSVGDMATVITQPSIKRRFDIQFVPTDISAKSEGVANLIAELGELGELEVLSQPAADAQNIGFWQLRLVTEVPQEFFSEQINFIADHGAWRVSEEVPRVAGGLDAMHDVPSDDDVGYGFFAPLPATAANSQSASAMLGDGDGYGFFAPVLSAVSNESALVAPIVESHAAVFDELPAQSARAATASGTSAAESSIRVSVEKVDQLINLVGELVITQSMLLQAAQLQAHTPERLTHGLAQLERNTRDLQESVMSIRMMPISFVFSRFSRVVRDLSAKLGKQVDLKTIGEATELDKGLIERIADPLTHLIRNSLDHGIEMPEARVVAGKSPAGTITLKAYHQGGNVVIEVGDDGAGLQRDKILARARERGVAVSEQMTDQEVFGLIFEAGFSTADQVTDVSGRGVGMDVVRRNIQSMGGRVEIDSVLGVGTRMTVRLPLTLAILDGMSVAVGDQTYILPLSCVVESLQPKAGEIKTLSNRARVVQVRGEYLPVVVLHEIFNIKSSCLDLMQGIMIVLDADDARVALFVDALVGQHQVVIKSLEANYRRVQGVSGVTIMGDGHVAMILDVSAIAGMARSRVQKAV